MEAVNAAKAVMWTRPVRRRLWPGFAGITGVTGVAGIAIDMGSDRTRAWLPGRGMVCDAPTVTFPAAPRSGSPAGASTGAGAGYPVRRGTIVDVDGCARMLERLLGSRIPYGRFGRRPLVVLTVPVLSGAAHRAAALAALDVLRPRTVLSIDGVKAAAIGAGADLSEPLLVADIGAHLVEVALLADGAVVHARRAAQGTSDLGGSLSPAALVRSVAGMVTGVLRDDESAAAVDALDRGLLLVGGGALRPEITYRLAGELRAPVRPAPAPQTAAVRGAAAVLAAARNHPSATQDRRDR